MMAKRYVDYVITLVLICTLSMLVGSIYLWKINPSFDNDPIRHIFLLTDEKRSSAMVIRNGSAFARKISEYDVQLEGDTKLQKQYRKDYPTCTPKQNVVLLKTHKTGGSTLQNIVYRYGDNHDLNFALPKRRNNYFGDNAMFTQSFVEPLPNGNPFNALANHARWNKKEFVAMMPADTMYITILRHPATQFESLYSYYKWQNFFKVPFEYFVKDPNKFCNGKYISPSPLHSFKNPSLFDLGVTISDGRIEKDVIDKILHSLDEDFQLVLIMEYMEESVILLKELMCWSWEDILYFPSNSRSESEIQAVTPEIKSRLLEWNDGDWMLYRYFNETLWRKVKDYGFERMQNDKKILRTKIKEVKEKCLQGTQAFRAMDLTSVQKFQLTPNGMRVKLCLQMTKTALEYLYFLNDKLHLPR